MRHLSIVRIIATMLAFALCLAASSNAFAQPVKPKADPTEEDIEAAKEHMAAGVAFVQDPEGARYEEAYPEFKKAYELSGSLNALQNYAICAMKLELDGEAIEMFERFLEMKGDDIAEDDKAQVERDLRALSSSVAWVTLSADKPNTLIVDERTPRRGSPIRNTYTVGIAGTRLGIHPGAHEFTASVQGFEDKVWKTRVRNGGKYQHEFIFESGGPVTAEGFTKKDQEGLGGGDEKPKDDVEPEGGGAPVAAIVTTVLTGVAIIPWVAMMAVASGKNGDYEAARGVQPLEEQQALFDDVQSANTVADVLMIPVIGLAVTSVILFILHDPGPAEGDTASKEASVKWSVTPAIDPRGGGAAMLTATF